MNFALLGDDLRILPLVLAIRSSASHAMTHVLGVAPQTAVGREVVGARAVSDWEELLAKDGPDAVILAGDRDELLAAARRLLAEGKPLRVLPCLGQAASFVYELTLDEADSSAVLAPVFPLRAHPFVAKLVEAIRSGEFGAVLHLQLERRLIPNLGRLLDGEQLDRAFLADADLLRLIGGGYDQVTALRSGDPSAGFSLASITLAGASKPQAVWSASVAMDALPSWSLSVLGEHGTAKLSGDPDRQTLTFEVRGEDGTGREVQTADADGRAWLALADAVPSDRTASPTWTDLTRIFDWLDATQRSLRRRRTIDLHFEELSERSQFKSQMTAIGCGVLMFTLVAVVAYLMLAQMFELNDMLKHVLRIAIFTPLGLFLVAQLLLVLTRPASGRTG